MTTDNDRLLLNASRLAASPYCPRGIAETDCSFVSKSLFIHRDLFKSGCLVQSPIDRFAIPFVCARYWTGQNAAPYPIIECRQTAAPCIERCFLL